MKKIFSIPKTSGDNGKKITNFSHALGDVQPNLLFLARKFIGNLSNKSSDEKEVMFTNIDSEWPRRRRHPAGGNHPPPPFGKVRAERIVIEGDLLCYSEEEDEKVGVYIGEAPINRLQHYFEVEILQMGQNGAISVGLCPQWYPLHKMPGWIRDSVGYHADDGKLYKGKSTGVTFGPKCNPGDRMGCGVKFESISPDKSPEMVPVFFTKNGREVGSVQVSVPLGGLFPCVGLVSSGDAVRLIPHPLWPPEEDTHMAVDSNEDEWAILYNLKLNGQHIEYSGRSSSDLVVGLAQARLPLTTSSHFFQLEIVHPGKHCFITIGLTRRTYPKHRHPGWNNGSIAYHGDDGHLFEGNSVGLPFGPPCQKGDIMGCGIIFPRDFVAQCQKCGGDCSSDTYCEELVDWTDELDGGEVDDLQSCVLTYSVEDGPNGEPIGGYGLALLSDSEDEFQGESNREDFAVSGSFSPVKSNGKSEASEPNKNKVEVFFTHNGSLIGRRQVTVPKGGMFPTVSMGSLQECVKVDLHPMSG